MADHEEEDGNTVERAHATEGTQAALPESVQSALIAEAERFQAAQRQVTDAIGLLWNAQLELSIATGNDAAYQKVMRGPLSLWDDCSCGCGPNPGCPGG